MGLEKAKPGNPASAPRTVQQSAAPLLVEGLVDAEPDDDKDDNGDDQEDQLVLLGTKHHVGEDPAAEGQSSALAVFSVKEVVFNTKPQVPSYEKGLLFDKEY